MPTETWPATNWLVAVGIAVVVLVLLSWVVTRRLMRRRQTQGETYVRALEAMAVGDGARAIRLLRETVDENTDNIGAYLHLGRLLRMRGDHERALRIHRELSVRRLSEEDRRAVLTEMLEDLVQAGRWSEAKTVALEIKRMGTPDTRLLRAQGKIYENLREWDDAVDTFEELERRQSKPSPRRSALYRAFVGLDYEQRGKSKEARKHYEAALKLDPSLPGALLHLGDLQLADGNVDKALEAWKSLIRQNPNAISLVFDRLENASYEKAPASVTELVADYERVLADSPTDVSTMRALASVHRRRGDTDEASRILSHALELQPDNQRLRLDRLQLLMETGDRDAAYQEMRDLLRTESGRRAEFSCRECGYRTEEYLWRCPACQRWETFRE